MASSQQAAQAAVASALAAPVANAWQLLDVANLGDTMTAFLTGLLAIVTKYGRASAALAAASYVADRRAAGVAGTFTVRPGPLPSPQEVSKSARWATRELWSRTPDLQDVNLEAARTNVDGVVENLTLGVGRATTLDAVAGDKKARAWAREVEPGACAFCLLLATRGAVYRTSQAGSFHSHPKCRCIPVAVFGEYEPTAEVRRAQALYQQAKTSGARGPKATRAAFRQLIATSPK